MRKKRSTAFRVFDRVIVLLCCAGISVSGMLFWKEYTKTLTKLNEDPVGNIVFKKRIAHRKFIDRVVWDTLKQNSPVYNGDTIRTVDQSEAYIVFRDQVTTITLIENSLLQVFYNEQHGVRLDFTSGNIEIMSGSRTVAVNSGSSALLVDGTAIMNREGGGLGLSVIDGQTSLNGNMIQEGGIVALNSSGQEYSGPLIAMTSFGSSARVLGNPGMAVPVDFAWNTSNFSDDIRVIIEVASDRSFRKIAAFIETANVFSAAIPLECGQYWWRAYPALPNSIEPLSPVFPSGALEMIPAVAARLLSPAHGAEFAASGSAPIRLSWSGVEGAIAYLVEISANQDMSFPLVKRHVQETGVIQGGLDIGSWYWRISPVFPSWVSGSVSPSAVGEFSVVPGKPVLSAPQLTFPLYNGYIDINTSSRRLLWRHDPNVSSWLVELSDVPDFGSPVLARNVAANYFSLPSEFIQPGKTWYWRVSAQGGEQPAVSSIRSFRVTGNDPVSQVPTAVVVLERHEQPLKVAEPDEQASPVRTAEQPAPEKNDLPEIDPIAMLEETPMTHGLLHIDPETEPEAEPEPEAELVTEIEFEAEPEPEPEPQPIPKTPAEILRDLLRVSGSGTVSGNAPPEGYKFTTEQIEKAPQLRFVWVGRATQYQFMLYRTSGEEVLKPAIVNISSYILTDLSLLTEGEYVWHVYEMDVRGRWGLPSTANRFSVVPGQAARIELQTNQRPIYGNE